MKLKFLPSLLIFISSYFPLTLIFLIKDLNATTFRLQHPIVAAVVAIVTLIACLSTLIASRSIKGGVPVKIVKVTNKSGDMFTYTIPYMVSFYNFTLGDWKTLLCLLVFMTLMFALAYRTQNLLVNPVLALVGFGLYDCQFKDGASDCHGLLLSKSEFRAGDSCVIERLSTFLYFVAKTIQVENDHA